MGGEESGEERVLSWAGMALLPTQNNAKRRKKQYRTCDRKALERRQIPNLVRQSLQRVAVRPQPFERGKRAARARRQRAQPVAGNHEPPQRGQLRQPIVGQRLQRVAGERQLLQVDQVKQSLRGSGQAQVGQVKPARAAGDRELDRELAFSDQWLC